MDALPDRLRARLALSLPGEPAQYRMAPAARPPMRESLSLVTDPRQSAVLLYLFPDVDDWCIVLMKRTEYDGPHGGQVSIPGGRLEPGEDHLKAALREFAEETGVRVGPHQVLGELSALFVPASGFVVRPFLACGATRPVFDPDPVEVAAIVELPVAQLVDDTIVESRRMPAGNGLHVDAPCFAVGGHAVWGATAMILSELKVLLREA